MSGYDVVKEIVKKSQVWLKILCNILEKMMSTMTSSNATNEEQTAINLAKRPRKFRLDEYIIQK